MARIELEENEEITRKEYFRRKKNEERKYRKTSKITILMILFFVVLVVYVIFQIYLYKSKNNYSYLADEEVLSQDVFNVFYVTKGYTYDPKYSLSTIYSNGFNEKQILSDIGFSNIALAKNYILGIKDSKLCALDKNTYEVEELVKDENVEKFTVHGSDIYLIVGENKKICKYNLETKEFINYGIEQIYEIVVNENQIFIVQKEKAKKQLYSGTRDCKELKKISNDANVSYVILNSENLYFVNKADGNKIYSVKIDGSDYKKVADITSVTDKGILKNIDGTKYMYIINNCLYYINSGDNYSLWKYNLETGENEQEISMQIEILQNVNDTVFYKIKNSVGVYLYNLNTKFMSEITKRNIEEFIVDENTKVFITKNMMDSFKK